MPRLFAGVRAKLEARMMPWAAAILEMHAHGVPSTEIARRLYPEAEAYYRGTRFYDYVKYYSSIPKQNIHYVLRRIGAMPPPPQRIPIVHFADNPAPVMVMRGKRLHVLHTRTPTLETLGRPIDMGGPRDQWLESDPWSDPATP
jgi:hypothetical protein